MPQEDEIYSAFRQAIRQDENGGLTVSTHDFVAELQRRNRAYTLRAANYWIEIHISRFRDISAESGDYRLFELPAPEVIIGLPAAGLLPAEQPDP